MESLSKQLRSAIPDLPAVKTSLISLLEYLCSPVGRTDANCGAVDSFFTLSDDWLPERLPDEFQEVFAHMDALHDTITTPHTAANFGSTPEQLLEQARALNI